MRFTVLALVAALVAASAFAADFQVRAGNPNLVTFTSKATMEEFSGKTRKIAGTIAVDPAAVGDSVQVHLEVDLASLDTGLAKRNQHMREDHLETAKFPKAIFDGATIVSPKGLVLTPNRPVTFDAAGTFTLHGVQRRMVVRIESTYDPGAKPSAIRFQTTFPVALADYDISRPQFLFLKLADTQTVRVSAVAQGP